MLYIAIAVLAFLAGYHYKKIVKRVVVLEEKIELKIEKRPEPEVKSLLVDPTDEVQNAQFELEQQQKILNHEQ